MAAGLTVTARAIRRGAAQTMAASGSVSLQTIAEFLGHRQLNTTRRYLNFDKADMERQLRQQQAGKLLFAGAATLARTANAPTGSSVTEDAVPQARSAASSTF